MPYRYETHMHTCQSSLCGRTEGREHARFYKDKGYQGIIITDHFFGGNTAAPMTGPWRERVEAFCAGYEDALAEGQRIGLDVFFGWEQRFEGDEYLVYGLDKRWLIAHPEMEHWTRKQQYEEVRRYGGCVVQAHPFRDRAYIPQILLGLDYADAVEIANAGNLPYNDAYAAAYVKRFHLRCVAGSDNHRSDPELWNERPLMGVETDERLRDIHDYIRLIREGGALRPLFPPQRLEQGRMDAPKLETFWLDPQEKPVPTDIQWLA